MKKEQRRNLGEKIAQGILLIVLITLTIFMMSDVKKIQGNARVINYAGIIRGATQREIKLEKSSALQAAYTAHLRRSALLYPPQTAPFQRSNLLSQVYPPARPSA